MAEGETIIGMAWDHPRAVNPLTAVSTKWTESSGIRVEWVARSLKAFEDQPLEELAEAYDLVLMDYPFTGTAAASQLISPVEDWTDAAYLADQRRNSVGPSYSSYTFQGRQWALAVDAACQVSAWRPDLWDRMAAGEIPDSWDEVATLAAETGESHCRLAMPLNPNHAYCAFISVGLGLAGSSFWPFGECCDDEAGVTALEFLKPLAANLHPASRQHDPIGISDRMATGDEILFVPLMFGYSNYARKDFRTHRLRFGNAPKGPSGTRGSVLGGVGIALSSQSTQAMEAADLARTLASPPVQCGTYVDSGGQPGHSRAWESASANAQTWDFFTATRSTIEHAFVRPRIPGHRLFQQQAGELIHQFLWTGSLTATQCMRAFLTLYRQHLADWEKLERA